MNGSNNIDITSTSLSGAYVLSVKKFTDERGDFRKLFDEELFSSLGLCSKYVEINNSMTAYAGCIRGLHYQRPPFAEVKLVRCIRGEVYDVIVDVREGSPTFMKWHATLLSESDDQLLYVPEGFAHGIQALTDNSEIIYLSSSKYQPGHEEGVRFDEEKVAIEWKLAPRFLSEKDMSLSNIESGFKGVQVESPSNR